MAFSRRYALWLTIPSALLGLTLACLFLHQVLDFPTTRQWYQLAALIAGMYGIALTLGFLMYLRVGGSVERAVASKRGVPERASRCLEVSEITSLLVWLGGGLAFTFGATALFLPTLQGIQLFGEAALLAAAIAMAWNYWGGKALLLKETADSPDLHYTGRSFTFGAKIAMVFIGFFILSSGAMVHLVSSSIARKLEALAITSNGALFERIYAVAGGNGATHKTITELMQYAPSDYSVYLVEKNGSVASTGGSDLTSGEIETLLRLRNGNTRSFTSPHVGIFRQLNDGTILFLAIPWGPYENIPGQVGFYVLIIAALTTILFGVATWYLSHDLSRPLRSLMRVSSEMASGNFEREIRVFSDDEVGELSDSFRENRENLRRLLARISGNGTNITDGVRVMTGGTDTLMARSREQYSLTNASSAAVENVRRGMGSVLGAAETVTNLTEDASAGALELQRSAEEVARNMDYLFQSVEKTTSSTAEIDASLRGMSERTGVLAGIGEDILAFISQMEATVEELRQNAQSTAEISRQVQEKAADGGRAVDETVAGISLSQEITQKAAGVLGELQSSVAKISQILTVIEEVADKTNLLSLNAAIIAAQAGEHGLGFTVVADEIRELAERTRGSTKEIGGIIKALQKGSSQAMHAMSEGVSRVGQTVDLSQRASESLHEILDSAATSYEMATRISRALQEQTDASRHLHQVASRMTDHISEINRGTREQSRASELLAEESERVRDIAQQVKSSTDQQSAAGREVSMALEKIAADARAIRDLLQDRLRETDRIASAAQTMLAIAQENEGLAQSFTHTMTSLVSTGQQFEDEVRKFKIKDGR